MVVMIHFESVGGHSRLGGRLNKFSYSFRVGEHVAIYGGVNSGLETLVSMLTGQSMPSEGLIRCTDSGSKYRGGVSVAYAPEIKPCDSQLTVSEFMTLYTQIHQLTSEGLEPKLNHWGLSLDKSLNNLSPTQFQALNLCLASEEASEFMLIHNPYIGLDSQGQKLIQEHIESLSVSKTIIYCTNYLQDLPPTIDTLMILKEGQISRVLTLDQLIQASQVQITMGCSSSDQHVLEKIQDLKTVEKATAIENNNEWTIDIIPKSSPQECRESIYREAKKQQWTLHTLKNNEPSIEELVRHSLGQSQ